MAKSAKFSRESRGNVKIFRRDPIRRPHNKLSSFLPRDTPIRPLLRQVHLLYLLRDAIYPYLDKSKKAEDILVTGNVPESYVYLKELKETAEQHKLLYRIVLLPSLRSRFGPVPAQLLRDGISFIDLSFLRDGFSPEQFRASKFDTHPSAKVHKEIGESLAEYILDHHLIKTPD